jgi:D-3-phosphoglycerate dehydrogenase
MVSSGRARVIIANKNVPNMVGQITSLLAAESINIAEMLNKHRGDLAYNIIDIDSQMTEEQVKKLSSIPGIVMVRVL